MSDSHTCKGSARTVTLDYLVYSPLEVNGNTTKTVRLQDAIFLPVATSRPGLKER